MSNNNVNIVRNGSENDIDIIKLISPKFAIRAALGNLGMGNLIQNLEQDLIRWTGEANEKITQNTKAATIYVPSDQIAYTKNNRVKLCEGFMALQCLKLNGCTIPFLYNKHRCASNCENSCGGGGCGCCNNVLTPNINHCSAFYLDGCFVKFSPAVADGEKVEIAAWKLPMDEEGYVQVIESTVTAIQEYVAWQVCRRERDSRVASFEKSWYFNCRTARATINKKTDAELREISRWWQPQGFYMNRNYNANISY